MMPATPASITEALATALDATRQLIETTAGYRAICIEQGFSETAAEMMAVAYHDLLIRHAALGHAGRCSCST